MNKQFQLGINVDNYNPDQICKGWEFLEIPMGMHLDPFLSDNAYDKMRKFYKRPGYPPIIAASHFLQGYGLQPVTGENTDWDQLAFWSERGFKRLADLRIACVGVYGAFFPIPEGASVTKAKDNTLRFFSMLADLADKYGVLVALEPMARLDTVFPRYRDALALAKELGRDKVRVMADLAYFLKLDQPLEDILLQKKMLATNYNYRLSVGVSYTFGSIYSNIVNPRFGR